MVLNNWRHACWAVVASLVGMLVGIYHHDSSEEVAALGLYGYNAVLAAVALSVWRPSVLAPLLGIMFSVPITETFPAPRVAGPDCAIRAVDLAGPGDRAARRLAVRAARAVAGLTKARRHS